MAYACWRDLRSNRIPNWLNAALVLSGLFVHGWFSGWTGIQQSFLGLLTGFSLLIVLWLMRAMDLTVPSGNENLADLLRGISEGLYLYQAAHDTSVTNIGAGMDKAINELSSNRARNSATKYIVLLTDGKPNVNSSNSYVGNNSSQAIGWALDRAETAQEMGMVPTTASP